MNEDAANKITQLELCGNIVAICAEMCLNFPSSDRVPVPRFQACVDTEY